MMSAETETYVLHAPSGTDVTIRAEMPGGWFKITNAMIDDGTMARLGNAALRVFLVLSRMANSEGMAWPSVATLVERTGCSRRDVFRAIRELEQAKLVTRRSGGGQRRTNWYRVNQTVPPMAPLPESNGATGGTRTVPPVAPHQDPKKNTQQQPKVIHSCKPSAPPPCPTEPIAAADLPKDKNRQALIRAGIAEPTRSRLAALPGLTPDLIASTAESVRGRGKGVGVLVLELRAVVEQRAAMGKQKRHLAQVVETGRRNRLAEIEAFEAGEKRARDVIAAMPTPYRAMLVTEAVASMSTTDQRRVGTDPMVNRTLRASVLRQHAARAEPGAESRPVSDRTRLSGRLGCLADCVA